MTCQSVILTGRTHGPSLTKPATNLRHPFRTPKLTGAQVGWFRPAAAIVIALFLPALLAVAIILIGAPTVSGPPKDGTGYSIADHIALVLAVLSASIVMSWMIAPLALVLLRAAAMLGYAGWGTAILAALAFGLPMVHITLMGDVTTEENAIPAHIITAIAILGFSVWAVFWGLMALSTKRLNTRSG